MAVAAIGATRTRSLRCTLLGAASSISLPYSTSTSVQPAPSAVSSVGEDEHVAKKSGRRSGWTVLLLFLPCAATFGLGTWQLFRRQWKMDMLDYRRTRLKEDPIPLSAVSKEHQISSSNGSQIPSLENDLEYRQVLCEGIYDNDKSLYVGPRPRTIRGVSEKGYIMVTPLYPTGDSVQPPVLVNRGWVPSSWHEGGSKQILQAVDQGPPLQGKPNGKGLRWWNWTQATQSQEETTVPTETVRGVIRSGEQPNMFVPHNDPESGQWFYIDVPAMAHTAGLGEGTLLIEAVSDNDGLHKTAQQPPIPKNLESLLQSSVMPQDHLNYALTWYSLSAATTYMALKRLKLDKRVRK